MCEEAGGLILLRRVEAWNVLVTAHEGRRAELFPLLRRHGRFVGAGYRNVVIGWVDDRTAFFEAIRAELEARPALGAVLARAVPVDRVVQIDPLDPLAGLEPAVRELAPQLAGGSFHVRLERRGLKGSLHTAELERALGTVVWRTLEAMGHAPRVRFQDADRILAIETLGTRAGIGVIDRAMRQRWAFVRVD